MREKILLLILFLSILSCAYFYFKNPRLFLLFFRTIRLSRHLYYSLIFIAGFLLGLKISGHSLQPLYLTAGFFLINILFAASLIINNINDKKIDALNTKDNILNSNGFTSRAYYALFFILSGLSLILSLAMSLKVFLITVLIHFFSWIYSSPPLHLKKVFLINTLIIAFSSLLALLLGFMEAAGTIQSFPASLAATMIAALFFAFNTKDVNDYKGDKQYGIKTVVTVFGPKKGRTVTAVAAFAGYLLVPVLLNAYSVIVPSAVFGAVTYAVINTRSKKINETLIFALFFAYSAVFIFINPVIR